MVLKMHLCELVDLLSTLSFFANKTSISFRVIMSLNGHMITSTLANSFHLAHAWSNVDK